MPKLLEITYKIEDIDIVASQLLQSATSKIILFYGDMGAGKTTLIKALAKSIGCDDMVSSPTFSIVNEYEAKNIKIYHFDFYRLTDEEDALNFGFEDYIQSPNWVFIEWPENAKNLIPETNNIIKIYNTNKTLRSISLSENKILIHKTTIEQHRI